MKEVKGKYYLYTLSGHENYQYAYMYSRVSLLGPFEAPREDIIARTDHQKDIYRPGHGCVFSITGTDNYYFAYLEFGRGGTTRQVWVNKSATCDVYPRRGQCHAHCRKNG